MSAVTPAPRLVVGLQPVREAIRAHRTRIGSVLVARTANGPARERLDAVARFARDAGVEQVRTVPSSELDRLSGGVVHQGVAAYAPDLTLHPPESLVDRPELLAIALDGIEDPQNFGAVVRSAVGIANAWIVWSMASSAPLSLATFRASAGAIEHASLCRVRSLPEVLTTLGSAGVTVVGLDAQAPTVLTAVDLTGPAVLVIGGEHRGLKRAVRRACTCWASLVRPNKIDSLNASVAAGIGLYEASVQRMKSNG